MKDATKLFKVFDEMVEKVGRKIMVQVNIDNDGNN